VIYVRTQPPCVVASTAGFCGDVDGVVVRFGVWELWWRDGRTKYIWLECSTLACRTSGRQTMRYFDVSVKSTVPHQLIFHDGTTDGEPHGLDSSIDATFTWGGNKGARRQPSRNYNGQFAVLRAPISPLQMSSRERNESPHQRQSLRFTTSY